MTSGRLVRQPDTCVVSALCLVAESHNLRMGKGPDQAQKIVDKSVDKSEDKSVDKRMNKSVEKSVNKSVDTKNE